jgi:hypothetical protein
VSLNFDGAPIRGEYVMDVVNRCLDAVAKGQMSVQAAQQHIKESIGSNSEGYEFPTTARRLEDVPCPTRAISREDVEKRWPSKK